MDRKPLLLTMIALLLLPGVVRAQDDATCPDLVQSAYDMTQQVCEALGNDEACYGNSNISAEPETLAFSDPGDLAALAEIESLQLSSMVVEDAVWGISLIHVAALVEDLDAPQTVELVLFGNVEIANTAEEGSGFAPMQAFTFVSGADDRPCDEAPDSGIMIQTPQGVGEITLLVNEVAIDLGSTAFLQAEPGDEMAIHIVEGSADVTTDGATMTVPAGAWASVPLDEDGLADGPAEGPLPYDDEALQTLPVSLLTEEIAIAPAIEAEEGITQGGGSTPIAGTWSVLDCDNETTSMTLALGDNNFTLTDGTVTATFTTTEPGQYLYATVDGEDISELGFLLEFQSISEDRMEASLTGSGVDCTLVFTR